MKTVDENIKDLDVINNEEKIEFKISVSEFDGTSAHLRDEEDLDPKTIGYIEREVRNSFEYRNYISYLKNELDLTRCALLPNLDIEDAGVSLEFHHFPLTLFDITEIVAKDMLDGISEEDSVSCFDVAEKIVEEHYNNNIGLVPVTKSIHEMAHNGSIFIPTDKVHGNYKRFLAEYRKSIDPQLSDKIEAIEMYNTSQSAKEFNSEKLKKRIANYDITYEEEGGNEDGTI